MFSVFTQDQSAVTYSKKIIKMIAVYLIKKYRRSSNSSFTFPNMNRLYKLGFRTANRFIYQISILLIASGKYKNAMIIILSNEEDTEKRGCNSVCQLISILEREVGPERCKEEFFPFTLLPSHSIQQNEHGSFQTFYYIIITKPVPT